jgi:hypothetical protein
MATRVPADHTEQPKLEPEFVEGLDQTPTHATYLGREDIASLSQEHRDYLIKRHGTLDLDPLPGFGNADPYNWPAWKV